MAFGGVFGIRRKDAATWTSDNTVLFAGEIAVETDTRKTKIGDGVTAWTSLGYTVASASVAWTDIASIPDAIGAIDGLTPAADRLAYYTGASTAALATFTAAGRALVDDADAAAQRTTLGLVIGTNVQAWDSDLDALAALSGTNTIYYRSGAATWTAVTVGTGLSFSAGSLTCTVSGISDGDKGDITVSSSGTVWTVDAGTITLAKQANLAANSIIGNNTGSPAVPLALTGTQVTAMLDAFTSGAKGLAPASGGGTTNFLRADGSWASPGGGTTFADNVFRVQDNGDATKQIAFEASGITTGTTRTFTAPDASGTLVLDTATQTLSSKTLDNTTTLNIKDTLFTLQDDGDATKQARFQLSGITTGTTRTYILPDNTGGTFLMDNVNQTVSGQWTFSNATNNFGTSTGNSFNNLGTGATLNGNTKAVAIGTLGVSGSTTNVTIGSAVAGALGTLTINSATIALGANVSAFNVKDSVFFLQDNGDATKQAQFQLSGITTATTRTYTLPDATGTLALNTTFTSAAAGLAPASGGGTTNYLRADGTWAAPPGSGGSPAGSSGQIQYNNASAFGGATDISIDGGQLSLTLVGSTPSAPGTTTLKAYGTTNGARPFPHFMRKDGIERPLQQNLGDTFRAEVNPVAGTAAPSTFGIAVTAVGTQTASAGLADTNAQTRSMRTEYLVTVAATTAVAGLRLGSTICTVGGAAAGRGGFYFAAYWGPATGPSTTAGTMRAFCGLSSSVVAPTDVNPSTVTNMIGMAADAADTNYQFMYNDGAGTATKIDLGASFAKSTADRTDMYKVVMYSPAGTTQEVFYEITNMTSGAVASGSVNTDLPSTTTYLGHRGWCSVGGTSSVVGYAAGHLIVERQATYV